MGCMPRSRYDVNIHKEDMDLSTSRGFINGLKYTLRLKKGALFWGGNPCSNQIFMSSSVHQRSAENPMGDVSKPSSSARIMNTLRAPLMQAPCGLENVFSIRRGVCEQAQHPLGHHALHCNGPWGMVGVRAACKFETQIFSLLWVAAGCAGALQCNDTVAKNFLAASQHS